MNMPPTSRGRCESIFGYSLLQTIGSGAFSTVKLAKHGMTGVMVAIKILDLRSFDGATQDLLMSEERIMNSLVHPNIVRLFQVIDTVNKRYLVMEYTAGGTLEDVLKLRKQLQPQHAAKAFRQICTGISFMHSESCVHRDLKPANVFISSHGIAKLGDFGFAARSGPNVQLKSYCGSLPFAAPEIVLGAGAYNGPPVDMWAAGVLLHTMLHGVQPYNVVDTVQLQADMKSKLQFKSQNASLFTTSAELGGLVAGLLEYTPERRLTAMEVLHSQELGALCPTEPCEDAPLLSKVGSSLSAKQINFFLGVFKGPDAAITGDADLNVALKQLAKRKLIGHGAKLEHCCSKTSLADPRQSWTGAFRAIRHSETLKLLEQAGVKEDRSWMELGLGDTATPKQAQHGRRKHCTKTSICAIM